MADLLLLQRYRQRRQRDARIFRNLTIKRSNQFDIDEKSFLNKFRLNKECVIHLTEILNDRLHKCTRGYSVDLQVLTALRLLGSGSFQNVISTDVMSQSSQSTISRTLNSFCDAIIDLCTMYIKFPVDAAAAILENKRKFFNIAGFPNVVGVVDGTHVSILKPSCDDWFVYLNRKNRFTVNVQVICDADCKVIDVVANWPGSAHDAFIWNRSQVRDTLSSFPYGEVLLIGDSGYPIEPWLMTPYTQVANRVQENFNKKLRKTRTIVERTIGIVKGRFRILDLSGGTLLYSPRKVCKIVIACIILHNIAVSQRIPLPDAETTEDDSSDNVNPANLVAQQIILKQEGERSRQNIANNM